MQRLALHTVLDLADQMERSLVILEALACECDEQSRRARFMDMRHRISLVRRDLGSVANIIMEHKLSGTRIPPVKAA